MQQDLHNRGEPAELDYRPILEKRHQRNLNRNLFREMIKTELEDRPMGWLRRRTLVKFATKLGIDEFEARLILRAVEFECGKATPSGQCEMELDIPRELIAGPKSTGESWMMHVVAVAVVAAIAAGFGWLRTLN